MNRISFLLAILSCFLSINCQQLVEEKLKPANPFSYIPTIIPVDTTKLWISSGDPALDTVLIVGEGGPKSTLDFESNGRVYWEYLPENVNYHYVVVNQSSTYNKSILSAPNFSMEDAKWEVDNSSEMMFRAIKYYKDRGKYVVVFGHSYSAWVVQHYLSTRPSLADKYIITGGRLDADSLQTRYSDRVDPFIPAKLTHLK